MLSILRSYAVVVDLKGGYQIKGKIVAVQKNEISLDIRHDLFLIKGDMITKISDEGNLVTIDNLLLKSWDELDNNNYYGIYNIEEGYASQKKIFKHLTKIFSEEKFYPVGNYVKLLNGKEIYNDFTLKTPLFSKAHILLDDETKISFKEVECYQYESEFYQRIPNKFVDAEFAQRVLSGKVDLYSITSTFTGGGGSFSTTPGLAGGMAFTAGTSSHTKTDYFVKDGGPLQKANYRNLVKALADNNKSMKSLAEYKTLSFIEWGMILGGAGLILGGIGQIDQEDGISPDGRILLVSGGMLAACSQIPGLIKSDKIEDAIEEYND